MDMIFGEEADSTDRRNGLSHSRGQIPVDDIPAENESTDVNSFQTPQPQPVSQTRPSAAMTGV